MCFFGVNNFFFYLKRSKAEGYTDVQSSLKIPLQFLLSMNSDNNIVESYMYYQIKLSSKFFE